MSERKLPGVSWLRASGRFGPLGGLVGFPVLLAMHPVLFLFGHNQEHFSAREVPLPLGLAALAAWILWRLLDLWLKDSLRSGILATCWMWLFLGYFRYIDPFVQRGLARFPNADPHGDTLLVLLALGLGVLLFVLLMGREQGRHKALLDGIAWSLVILTALPLAPTMLFRRSGSTPGGLSSAFPSTGQGTKPNLVHIVLDGYAREDILRTHFGFDNRPFMKELEKMGFHASAKARANYCQTLLSLSSTLNVTYVQEIAAQLAKNPLQRHTLARTMAQPRVLTHLSAQGYHSVALASGYDLTEMTLADEFIRPCGMPSTFMAAVLDGTPMPALLPKRAGIDSYQAHRQRVLATFDQLGRLDDRKAPLFVFAHVVTPHPPFIFAADGSPRQPGGLYSLIDGSHLIQGSEAAREAYRKGYVGQVEHVNARILESLNRMLARATRPTVVFLHSDHGPGSGLSWEDPSRSDLQERLGILLACRVPDPAWAGFPEEITTVNAYQSLLSTYFGLACDPLPQKSYFSRWSEPFDFIEVTDQVSGVATPPTAKARGDVH